MPKPALSTRTGAADAGLRGHLLGPFAAPLAHRSLLRELLKREILGRYRGANFGLLWSLISPFLMLGVYTFAFGHVMAGRWPQAQAGETGFALIVFVGLIVHGFFAECLNRAPTLVTSNPSFVKRVVFPLELLPWTVVLSALFHALTNTLVFIALNLAFGGRLPWTAVLLPVVMLPLACLALGVSGFLAALGVYVRDVAQVTGLLATALLFMSSALVPLEAVSPRYRPLFELNPLTFPIDQAREVLLWGHLPDWTGLAAYFVAAVVVMYVGRAWFAATQKGFADVL